MKKLLLLTLVLISLETFAQINFEKGYFIENSGKKVICLIKNADWYTNPKEFKYKLSRSSKTKTGTISTVKEFGINNFAKFIKRKVGIDRSASRIEELSENRKAILTEEVLFLKVLVEGTAILYHYRESNLERFFIKKGQKPIQQLIYKKYTQNGFIRENNLFRIQLSNQLKCEIISHKKINKLKYQKKKLTDLFILYNQCVNKGYIVRDEAKKLDKKKYFFNFSIRPRLNYADLKNTKTLFNSFTDLANNTTLFREDIKFNTQSQSMGFGLEAELILPFNKNKWAIILEPNYSAFTKEVSGEFSSLNGVTINTTSSFNFLNIPIGLRHYFFPNSGNNSKLFINASLSYHLFQKARISYSRVNNSKVGESEFSRGNLNYNFGIGYKYKDKYSFELRHTPNQISQNLSTKSLEMSVTSIIFGYTIF